MKICFLFLILFSFYASADIVLNAQVKNSLNDFLDSDAQIIYDQNGTFLPEQVLKGVADAPLVNFQKGKSITFGYMKYPAWVKLHLVNPSDKELWMLSLLPAQITNAEAYLFNSDQKQIYHAEYDITQKLKGGARPWMNPRFQLPIKGSVTLLLKIYSPHNINLDIQLSEDSLSESDSQQVTMLYGIYLGIVIALLFYTLSVYMSLKEETYLYYIFFMLAMCSFIFVIAGYVNYYFGSSFNAMRFLGVFSAVLLVSTHLFTLKFLHLKEILPFLDKVHKVFTGVSCFLAAVFASPLFYSYNYFFGVVIDFAVIFSAVLIFISTAMALKKGFQSAQFFLLAWSGLLVCVLVYYMDVYALIPSSFFTQHAIQIGSAFEMILLSVALAARIKEIQIQKRMSDEKAEQTDRLRSLVHITCHDLANPLSVILHNAEIGSHRGEGNWHAVLRACHHQKAIIDFVRTQEALDTGKTSVQLSAVSVKEVMEDVHFIFKKKLAEKRISLNLNMNEIDEQLMVQADPTLLAHSILNNLISNAIKFSYPDSEIEMRAHAEGSQVVFEIIDHGMGIPKTLIPNLFSNFHKTTREGTGGEKGTGFGMPLVKEMVEAFGGEIKVESYCEKEGYDNHGTTFKVLLIKSLLNS